MEHTCIKEGIIGRLEEAVENLEGWQRSQNGSIHRVEEKVDKLIFWGMSTSVMFGLGLLANLILLLLRR